MYGELAPFKRKTEMSKLTQITATMFFQKSYITQGTTQASNLVRKKETWTKNIICFRAGTVKIALQYAVS